MRRESPFMSPDDATRSDLEASKLEANDLETSDLEANKALVRLYFERMASDDPAVGELLAEDAAWWVPPSTAYGGTYEGREAVLALMGSAKDLYDAATPLEVDIQQLIAEGEWVSAQFVMRARSAKGEPYENYYHFAFQIRDGLIVRVHEYLDTKYVYEKLMT